jgi:hypothetical protein
VCCVLCLHIRFYNHVLWEYPFNTALTSLPSPRPSSHQYMTRRGGRDHFIIFGVIQVCTIGVRITAPHDSSSNPKT